MLILKEKSEASAPLFLRNKMTNLPGPEKAL